MKTLFLLAAVSAASLSAAVTVDFDSLSAGDQASNAIAGLKITSGNLVDGLSVGQQFAWSEVTDGFKIYSDPNTAWSGDNVAYAPGTQDALIEFSTSVTAVSLLTDRYPNDGSDVVRLLGLKSLGGGMFEVMAIASGIDGAVDGPGNLLSISGSFTHVAFESTTEQEGFDDLSYEPVPEPASLAALALGMAALRRRRRA